MSNLKTAVMKKFSSFLIVIFLISVGSSFQRVAAQEKSKDEMEKEQKIQQEIDQQKKAMADQKKAQTEAAAVLDDQIKNYQEEVESRDKKGENIFRYMPRGNRALIFDEPFNYSVPDMQAFYGHLISGDSERTTWDFSRAVKDNTFSREYSFEVEKSVKSVVMSVMGDCKSGEIHIKIVMPNGKNYSDILIDESGNLNWRKSFTISESENQDKTGDWKFQISSTKATGYFRISLQSF
jgi:Zn-dependent metalloprotease